MATPVLPPGPYHLKSGFGIRRYIGGGIMVLAFLAMATGGIWLGVTSASQILREGRAWEHGVEASASVGGTRRSNHFIFNEYKLDVEYLDQTGTPHRHKLSFETMFSTVDDSARPYVKYLPEDPDQFALSWAHNVTGGRWLEIVLIFLVLVGFGGVMGFGGVQIIRNVGHAKRAARAGQQVEVTVTEVKTVLIKGKDKGHRNYFYKGVDPAGNAIDGKLIYVISKGQPLFVDKAESKILMLVGSGKAERIGLRQDFYPLDLSDADQASARANLERRAREA